MKVQFPIAALLFAALIVVNNVSLRNGNRVDLVQTENARFQQYRTTMRLGNEDLKAAQSQLREVFGDVYGRSASKKAHYMMLHGIGGLGAGEEGENENDWEVAMHLDAGCKEHLKARSEDNPSWKRLPSVTCIPNKRQNPMMWPYDAPGKVWLHDSTDSTKEIDEAGKHWPYKEKDLRDWVDSAELPAAWADGTWREQDPPVVTKPADDDAYWDQFDHAADAVAGHGTTAGDKSDAESS